MHTLYLHYLGCKSNWAASSLIITVRKTMAQSSTERYEYWTYDKMLDTLGKDLADDLVQRHKAAEASLPLQRKGHFIKKSASLPSWLGLGKHTSVFPRSRALFALGTRTSPKRKSCGHTGTMAGWWIRGSAPLRRLLS